MSKPAKLWIDILPKRGDPRSDALRRRIYCLRVLEILAERHPDLYTGKMGAHLSIDDASALVRILKENTAGHIVKHRLSYLCSGLEKGIMELNWDVAIPSPPVVIPRDKPCFADGGFSSLADFYRIEEAFLAALTGPPPDTPAERLGQVLLSAILFGGLVSEQWLAPWVAALAAPRCTPSLLWLDMVLTPDHLEKLAKGKTFVSRRDGSSKPQWEVKKRWFADPLTHALVLRLHNLSHESFGMSQLPSPLRAIRSFLSGIMADSKDFSNDFFKLLLSGAKTRLCLQIPPFLMAYAQGKSKSVSLPIQTWERLLTGMRVPAGKMVDQQGFIPPPTPDLLKIEIPQNLLPPSGQEKLLMTILKEILPADRSKKRKASESKSALQEFYLRRRNSMSQAVALLLHWCMDLLTHYSRHELIRRRVKGSIRASSVRRYLDAIGKKIVAVAGNMDILSLESDELHDLYREIINLCSTPRARQTAGERLAAFHEFLIARFDAPNVDFSDLLLKSGPSEIGVDPNIISMAEFDLVKRALVPNYSRASRLRRMVYLIAVLGFRCGLRRREALKLRIVDLQGETEPELLVRSNRYAYCKSSESVRRVPHGYLLEQAELDHLMTWRREREREENTDNPDALLFCMAGTPTTLLPENDVFPTIVQAMHQVTGDMSLHYHHMRHSFASWLLLRLLKDFPQETRKALPFLNHPFFDTGSCAQLRKAILGNNRIGRQALYAVAQLCGHGTPEVTLLHYFHFCDWLLRHELANTDNQPSVNPSIINAITGIPAYSIYFARKRKSENAFHVSAILDRIKVPHHFTPQLNFLKLDASFIPERDVSSLFGSIPLWHRVGAVLRERQLNGFSFGELSIRHGFPEKEVRRWCANAELLSRMKTKLGKRRHINEVSLKKNPVLLFPLPPHLHLDREMAEYVISSLDKLKAKNRKVLDQGVSCFVERFCASQGAVLFDAFNAAKRYTKFLMLVVSPEQIRVRRIMPRGRGRSHAQARISLAKRFGLPSECIDVINPHATVYSRHGEIEVRVLNPSDESKGGQVRASYGFRYALYIFGIIHGIPNNLLDQEMGVKYDD